ncbi:MAG: ABC transporter ATP-binding protein [Clostridia bacterium]|nr:ABC transporter ATP-binding protein [Clostridia bacterium]
MISVTGLSKRYGTYLAVDDVSFNIEKGEIIGFLGPNGAGKSTIMNILTGYLSMTKGSVSIDGYDIVDYPEKAKKKIGYLPELPPLYTDMKVREYLNFIYDLKGVKFPKKPHIDEVLRLVKIDNVQNRLIKNLSKGYRQRVGFGAALVGNPDVLVLDEPTVGLDPKQIIEIRNLITKLGKNHTIILSSHILSEIQTVCDRIIIINRGKLIADDNKQDLIAKISKDRSLVAQIIGDENKVIEEISKIEGVLNVYSNGKVDGGAFEIVIEPMKGADVRTKVFNKTVGLGASMLSFKDNSMSLEQVFLRLTEATDSEVEAMLSNIKEKTGDSEEGEEE